MKRPGVSEKKTADPTAEPDLYEISKRCPLNETTAKNDDSIRLQCTLDGGPKARMPIICYPGTAASATSSSGMASLLQQHHHHHQPVMQQSFSPLAPRDQSSLQTFSQSLAASEKSVKLSSLLRNTSNPMRSISTATPNAAAAWSMPRASFFRNHPEYHGGSILGNSLPHSVATTTTTAADTSSGTSPSSSALASLAAANQSALTEAALSSPSFAAGFAAATAFSQHQFRTVLGHLSQEK
jgi:hypothetical protein